MLGAGIAKGRVRFEGAVEAARDRLALDFRDGIAATVEETARALARDEAGTDEAIALLGTFMERAREASVEASPDALALIQFSSGSTPSIIGYGMISVFSATKRRSSLSFASAVCAVTPIGQALR